GFPIETYFEMLDSLIKAQNSNPEDDYYYDLMVAYDIFSAALGEFLKSYVLDLSPLEVVKYALDGLTSHLDPYTKFYMVEKDLDNELILDDYVGLGIVVNVVDSSLIVVDFVDTLTKEITGIKLGDKILYVNDAKVPPNQDSLRKYIGELETKEVTITLQREGIDSLLTIKTNLRRISIPEVQLAKIFDFDEGSVIYLKIQNFTYEMPEKVREHLTKFVNTKKNKLGIILDLRDNPGGVLESAIQLCEMFLPPGSTILSKKGKEQEYEPTCNVVLAPIDTSTPLIILVNRVSASASEVVAGAIQDNDRGVIIGEQTFGKGVIQSVVNLPNGSYLKLTTSIYLLPSGRSIHHSKSPNSISEKIEKKSIADSVFRTRNGRIVEQSVGIRPDITIVETIQNPFMNFLNSKMLFTLFVSYLENTQTLRSDLLRDTLKLLSMFSSYLKKKNISYKSPVMVELDSLTLKISQEEPNSKALQELDKIKKYFRKTIDDYVLENRKEIIKALATEIKLRTSNTEEINEFVILNDNYFLEAIKVLKNKSKYYKILQVTKN
ncbi:MAG: S41 family peptidase, partial [Candidatus Kapaibacteriota bacterium]